MISITGSMQYNLKQNVCLRVQKGVERVFVLGCVLPPHAPSPPPNRFISHLEDSAPAFQIEKFRPYLEKNDVITFTCDMQYCMYLILSFK